MRHRWRERRVTKGSTSEVLSGLAGYRCKRCGAEVVVARASGRGPYDELERARIPQDCHESIARRVMES